MGNRTPYTAEQREARDQADNALRERARELLADPAAVATLVHQLVTVSASPKVLRYSLRNQAMLASQAGERGMVLTDVDSFKGWRDRGRCVRRGERGLRIVAPRGTETSDNTDTDEPADASGEPREAAEETRVRFRMMSVFDISQTEGVEDAEEIAGPRVVPNPAALLRDTLTEQLERRGWRIEVTDTETGGAELDERAQAVRLPAGAAVDELAATVAVLTGRTT